MGLPRSSNTTSCAPCLMREKTKTSPMAIENMNAPRKSLNSKPASIRKPESPILESTDMIFATNVVASCGQVSSSIKATFDAKCELQSPYSLSNKENSALNDGTNTTPDIHSLKKKRQGSSPLSIDKTYSVYCSFGSDQPENVNEDPISKVENNDEEGVESLVAKRTIWLQKKVSKSGSSFSNEESDNNKVKHSDQPNIVRERSVWLEKRVVMNAVALEEKPLLQTYVSLGTKFCRLKDKSLPMHERNSIAEVQKPQNIVRMKKKKKNEKKQKKTLVQERASWLEKQVSRNELFQHIESEEERDDDIEEQKTDIELRLEAIEKEMKKGHFSTQVKKEGVARRRSLTELP